MARRKGAAARTKKAAGRSANGATVANEAELWHMDDALRGRIGAAEHEHVVLELTLLKDISEAFEEHRREPVAHHAKGADPEGPDEYRAQGIFRVSWYSGLHSLP